MAGNPAKTINYFGQLFLLVPATFCCISSFIPENMFNSVPLLFILPILGIWQVIDFAILRSKNGYKKWYDLYIGAIIGFGLFAGFTLSLIFGYISISKQITGKYNFILLTSLYSIIIAWIYLLYWRKK